MTRYTLYGDLGQRTAAVWALVLRAKGRPAVVVPETASLSLALASRAGQERGPYLRTPEGFVLAGEHGVLEWLERVHPEPPLLPGSPVRRACARLLEDWVVHWLPRWPRRSWATFDRLGAHLARTGFLLGPEPTRADLALAAWLETEVLVREDVRARTARVAPRMLDLGAELIEGDRFAGEPGRVDDDTVPIPLLTVLEDVARDYHAFLVANQRALKDGQDAVEIDLGLGPRRMALAPEAELRRVTIGRELAALTPAARRDVARVLEPVGVWHALRLPPVLAEPDPADPRGL